MPTRYIALFRGINVGKAKRVSMADLKALFEELGYTEVKTLLNSGNVVFTAPRLTASAVEKIESALEKQAGFAARVTLISGDELATAIAENLSDQADVNPSRFLVAVLRDAADRKRLDGLQKQKWAPEALALGTRAAFLWCPDGILESPLLLAVGKALGDAVTTRNWATIKKLEAMACLSSSK